MCDYMHNQNRDYGHEAEFLLRKSKVAESRSMIDELGAEVFGLTSMSDRFRLQTNVALQLSHHKAVTRKKRPPSRVVLWCRSGGLAQ